MAEDRHPPEHPVEGSRKLVDKNPAQQSKGPKSDAKGQFAQTQHGAENDGTVSANPRVFSGDGDATQPIDKSR